MKDIVRCGLIGFGTVGKGVYQLLRENAHVIKLRTGMEVRIEKICDLQTDMVTRETTGIPVTDNWRELLEDDSIDTIIELIGGIEPAKTMIIECMKAGKNVVTANKKLLAEDGDQIFDLANSGSAKLGFEASIGGGIPCVVSLKSGLVGNRVDTVMGILNGTTNYILTQMHEKAISFDDALREAQEQGFAEADPSFDIEGYDAGHKITLLSMIAYNRKVHFSNIQVQGITRITLLDIVYAYEMGYVIKLLGISRKVGDQYDIRVQPTMLPFKHPLASVRDEFNAVMYDNDMTGPVTLYGKGAGGLPTASAVMSDIVQMAQKDNIYENAISLEGEINYLAPGERKCRYYLRMYSEDRAGILARVAGVLGEYNISIASVMQQEVEGDYVPIVIMTHGAKETDMLQSINQINQFDFISGEVLVIPVEDFD